MLQSFETTASPEHGARRLQDLRKQMAAAGLDGFLVPRADAHQGEWVQPRDERLAWLTGFTGSAGFCAALRESAGVFIDGRYRIQVKEQIDQAAFTPVPWPETTLESWLKQALPNGGRIGFDPWLHVKRQIEQLRHALTGSAIELVESENLVDRIWNDQPGATEGPIWAHPQTLSGESSADKRARLAAELRAAGQRAAVLTLPDSIAWLLNIRGADIARTPVVLANAILHDNSSVDFFIDPARIDTDLGTHLGDAIRRLPPNDFAATLDRLDGPVRVDEGSAPLWVTNRLVAAGCEIAFAPDPCIRPKACKNATEIAGSRKAHLRDGVAMAELLAWLAAQGSAPDLTEIDVVKHLESLRRQLPMFVDLSFETICGSGPNGAITHYRVTHDSNRRIETGDLLLIDSGGQYRDGTTDITRTIAIGRPGQRQRTCFTRVLKGMIAISQARWPEGLAGRDLDGFARMALWRAGLDFDHGTGHGVGAFLAVHEGPQRLSRLSDVPFEAGMILSNEPGYYREGEFGIRIENLCVVSAAPPLPDGDSRPMLQFETLSYTPIDRALIDPTLLDRDELDWLNRYHAKTMALIAPACSAETQDWLARACAPI